jgi:hypothetical protein
MRRLLLLLLLLLLYMLELARVIHAHHSIF